MTDSLSSQLDDLRTQIDALDDEMVRLLNRRASLAHEIGLIKRQGGHDLYVPAREQSILARICRINAGPLSPAHLEEIYRAIMTTTLALERIHGVLVPVGEDVGVVLSALLGPQVERIEADLPEGIVEGWMKGAANHAAIPLTALTLPGAETFQAWLDSGEAEVLGMAEGPSGPWVVIQRRATEVRGRPVCRLVVEPKPGAWGEILPVIARTGARWMTGQTAEGGTVCLLELEAEAGETRRDEVIRGLSAWAERLMVIQR